MISLEPCPFRLEEISVEIVLWHGTLDALAPLAAAELLASRLPNCTATFWPDEGHIAIARHWDEILDALVASGRFPKTTASKSISPSRRDGLARVAGSG